MIRLICDHCGAEEDNLDGEFQKIPRIRTLVNYMVDHDSDEYIDNDDFHLCLKCYNDWRLDRSIVDKKYFSGRNI